MRAALALTFALLAAPTAQADTALLIANTRYDNAADLRQAREIAALEGPLAEAGFNVIVVENGTAEAMRAGVSALLDTDERARVLIAVAGHVVRSDRGIWLLGTEADRPDLGAVGGQGLSLDVVMEVAARAPGRAIVLVGSEGRRIALGAGLEQGLEPAAGLSAINAPQGVALISGVPADLARLVLGTALRPGADLAAAVAASRGLEGAGFLVGGVPFLGLEEANATVAAGGGGGVAAAPVPEATVEDRTLWRAVRELNTAGAYRAYLAQFPEGAFASDARRALVEVSAQPASATPDPQAGAAALEAALTLGRAAREAIQRDLNLLGHGTRGIDGIFGPGTRGAIRAWQAEAGFPVTGFVNAVQVAALRDAAAPRLAAQEAADRAFWETVGPQDAVALRRYLAQYPRGLFADDARQRLAATETARRDGADAAERAAWEDASRRDSAAAYAGYLDAYPRGIFAATAQARIAALSLEEPPGAGAGAGGSGERGAPQAAEAALNLAQPMRVLVEQQLAAVGLDPGRQDGAFDAQSRIAIQTYQDARGLPATGYLDQITVVRLLAEAIGGRLFD